MIFTKFWLVFWSAMLSLTWLLPNHYAPWSTFHMDAWIAAVMMMVSGWVLLSDRKNIPVYPITVFALFAALIPVAQYFTGLIGTAGTAWISTAYLFGFLLSMVTGAVWGAAKPWQLADGLFLAIGLASIISVGLQILQWLSLDFLDLWSMKNSYGRPFGNLGQPNQLATLLLWGTLAAAWGHSRRYIGLFTTFLMIVYLLFGIALTQSRTAVIGVLLIVLLSWLWRRYWRSQSSPLYVTGLGVVCIVLFSSIHRLNDFLLLTSPDVSEGAIARISGELRPTIWRMFADAVLNEPLWGYGWNQVGWAQILVAVDHPPLYQLFSHSHNLFLDLLLWCGLPIGLGIAAGLIHWFWAQCKQVRNEQRAMLLMFVVVIANHAMFELPLHHAYFLLPLGLIMGLLNHESQKEPIWHVTRYIVVVLWALIALLVGVIIHDYSKIEPAYQGLRFEWAGLREGGATKSPQVTVLTMFSDYFELIRLEPHEGMNRAQLDKLETTTKNFPGGGLFVKLAYSLAINGYPDEAAAWLARMCRMVPKSQCALAKTGWEGQAASNSALAAVAWPDGQ